MGGKKQLILFCYRHGGDKRRFMTHLGPHTGCTGHFSHTPKIGTAKQSACQCVHQVLQEEIGSFGLFALQSAIFFIAVLFLMVSINMCRVISTFITQGAFLLDLACCSWPCFLNFFLWASCVWMDATVQRSVVLSPSSQHISYYASSLKVLI